MYPDTSTSVFPFHLSPHYPLPLTKSKRPRHYGVLSGLDPLPHLIRLLGGGIGGPFPPRTQNPGVDESNTPGRRKVTIGKTVPPDPLSRLPPSRFNH